MVDKVIRGKLLDFDIPHMYLHPSVYIHNDGKWYEDYWYMTFTEKFDCWDRKTSIYYPEPLTLGGNLYEVHTYNLDDSVIDKTPENNRLLFKMGGTTDGKVVCHQRLLNIFETNGDGGAWLQRVSEY